MKVTDITIEDLNRVEQTYQDVTVNPFLAKDLDEELEDLINESKLGPVIEIMESHNIQPGEAVAFGIHLGILIATAKYETPTVTDQAVS